MLLWFPWLCCALLREEEEEEEEEEEDLEGSLLLTVPTVLLVLFLLSPAAPLTLLPFLSALFTSLFSVSEVTATLSELITPVNSSGLPKLNIMQKE